MKKTVLLLVTICLCIGNLSAQEATDKLREEGDAAVKAKNYAVALEKYSEYLKQTNYQDDSRIFNAGFAANQVKNYKEAARFFDMALQKGYNKENSYVGKIMALRELDETDQFVSTLTEALKEFPGNTNLNKLGYGYLMKEGQAAQKSGNIAKAEEMFKGVLALSDKTYKSNALYSLGILYYNNGAKALQAATPLATSDPDKYTAEKAKANTDFTKAKDYLEQALTELPTNENAKKSLESVKTVLAQ